VIWIKLLWKKIGNLLRDPYNYGSGVSLALILVRFIMPEHIQYGGSPGRIRTVEPIADKFYYGYRMRDDGFYPLSRPFDDEEAAWSFLQIIAADAKWPPIRKD
jgi:hypothetical protein